jgi:hypothetical protein
MRGDGARALQRRNTNKSQTDIFTAEGAENAEGKTETVNIRIVKAI